MMYVIVECAEPLTMFMMHGYALFMIVLLKIGSALEHLLLCAAR